jgi:hypothetical protein
MIVDRAYFGVIFSYFFCWIQLNTLYPIKSGSSTSNKWHVGKVGELVLPELLSQRDVFLMS